jgi:hypothetical protein
MGEAFEALRFEGVGKLLMEAERLDDGIRIHYSMPSVHAAGILGFHPRGKDDEDDPGFPRNRDGWARSLTDLGYSYTFVASEQLEAGALEGGGAKAFVLPFSLALSPREVEALERFARGGGIVVADAAPGLFNAHVAWRADDAVNRLFGIAAGPGAKRTLSGPRESAGALALTSEGQSWGFDESALQGLAPFETGLGVGGGVPLVEIDGRPAVIARRVGKGFTVYLNLLFDRYPRLRRENYGGAAHRALLLSLFSHLGLRPAVSLAAPGGAPVAAARISRYRFGASEVVAVLQEPLHVDQVHGQDGVSVYQDASRGPVVRQDFELRLSRSAELVNVRTGAALGRADRAKATLPAGEAFVVALNPVPTGSLKATGPSAAARGEPARFALASTETGPRLVRVQVTGPDGKRRPEYSENLLLTEGTATFVLPAALNDPAGTYRLDAADVLSGASTTTSLELR